MTSIKPKICSYTSKRASFLPGDRPIHEIMDYSAKVMGFAMNTRQKTGLT
jgi:hypothetical protein